ncbi:MAG: DEAD/DEAH box helicase, partial [Armatimonadota bacterium]|nr:DEAD/DEAH box helicase [Armatimonadota bacterium]
MGEEKDLEVLALFHPIVQRWFLGTFPGPTPAQSLGWPPIAKGEHTLILAPTGSGKTLAAFLWGLNQLFSAGEATPPGIRILYVSPLKALNNDIERNLRVPLTGIRQLAAKEGLSWPALRVAVRTGDTTERQRQEMIRRPPHILITTPESLFLMLTAERSRELFRAVQAVIMDEIHALCDNKRGVHLSITLERLVHRIGREVQRIGLSATQRPLETVARFLGGQTWEQGGERLHPRPVTIVDAGMRREADLQVICPVEDFRSLPEGTVWPEVSHQLFELIRQHRTTLIFTNARSVAEKISKRLNELAQAHMGDPSISIARAHHGSIAREARLAIEEAMKAGVLPAIVATGTLELGIDIGSIDLVCQLQSPTSVSRGMQRVGRSGHLISR